MSCSLRARLQVASEPLVRVDTARAVAARVEMMRRAGYTPAQIAQRLDVGDVG